MPGVAEASPLLAPVGRASQRRTLLAITALVVASVVCIALLSPATGRTVLRGDGVVPKSQLSFTKAEEAHFKGPKKMGDVKARAAMNDYFDTLGEEYQNEHKTAMRHAFNENQLDSRSQSLSQWFNKMGAKYFRQTEAEKAARKASHPGKLPVHRVMAAQHAEMAEKKALVAEDPDDVPMEKKESVEDKMIRAVAEYQAKQKAAQEAKFARDNAEVKKEIEDVHEVEAKEDHFKEMREEAEAAAEKQQAKALKVYKSNLKAKEEAAEKLEEQAAEEQKQAVKEFKAAQEAKAVAAKAEAEHREAKTRETVKKYKAAQHAKAAEAVAVQEKEEEKTRQSVKQVEAYEDKAAAARAAKQIAAEKKAKEARDAAKAEAEKTKAARVAKRAAYEAKEASIREEAKEKAEERKQERKERKIAMQKERAAEKDKFKARLAKKEEERKALIAKNIKAYKARKAAEKAKLHHQDQVPLDSVVRRAEAIQDEDKVVPFQVKASAAGEKVKINFYMEAMCPGCKYYTKTVLGKLMEKPDFVSMVDFKLVPYGNGRLAGDSIECQHGEKECEGNTILACMQEHYPITADDAGFIPAFVCMEEENGVPADDFKKCAEMHSLDQDKIMTCANGPQGKALALAAAQDTESLNPPHEYAPWVTLNGQPMRDEAYDLQKNVCKAYDAGDKATSGLCSEASLKAVAKRDRAMLHDGGGRGFSVCHNDAWA